MLFSFWIFLCQRLVVYVTCLFSVQSAEKQGNQLHMNVYKMKGQACGGPLKTEVKELKGDLRPAPPYPSRVKTVDKGTQVTPEREAVSNQTDSPPPPPLSPPYTLSHAHCFCHWGATFNLDSRTTSCLRQCHLTLVIYCLLTLVI